MITYDSFRELFKRKGWKWGKVNLIGIKNTLFNEPNSFDDFFNVVYIDAFSIPQIIAFRCTTDPGFYWIQNPMNVKGTATLKEGNYPNLWSFGFHSGYEALVQTGVCTVYRDNRVEDTGYFGINCHHSYNASMVNKWSAGCQVLQYLVDFKQVMKICRISGLKKFDYTLLNSEDIL